MTNQTNNIEDIVNRYIYQVSKHIAPPLRSDIEKELKTLIYDMLEDKTQDNIPTKEDIYSVLRELGSPTDLAEKYRDKSRYLIGPSIFPAYLLIMKIVLAATLLGMTIVTVLDLLTAPNSGLWYEYVGNWFIGMVSGFFMSFAWVTIIFAIFEWRGVNLKELMPEWDVTTLPPIPEHEVSLPLWEPIVGIIFTIFIMIIFLSAPQLIGVYYWNNTVMNTIPIFDLKVLRDTLPLFLICMGLGLLKNIWEIVDRRYSIKYAIFTFVANTIEIILTIIIFTQFPIWNKDFIVKLNDLFHITTDPTLSSIWNILTSNIYLIMVVIYLIDTVSIIYKSLKNENKFIFHP
jgi:hypothetical protein